MTMRRVKAVVSTVGGAAALVLAASACGSLAPWSGQSGTCGNPGYSPAQMRTAYHMGPLLASGDNGRGVTIAIVDSFGSPTIRSDLRHFDAVCGIANPPSLRVITPAGTPPRFDSGNSDMVGWATETTLDVELAHAMAPGANILLVETPVSETEGVHGFPQIVAAENYVIGHHMADVISQSFGATEATFPSRESILGLRSAFLNATRAGVTVLASSGDNGSTDQTLSMDGLYSHRVTSWPASDPLVTAVGGTQVQLDGSGNRTAPDSVWQDDNGAAGGGISAVFARPRYQDSVAGVTGAGRGVPDISMAAATAGAASIWATFPGSSGWSAVGGTSEATPLLAGIIADADQLAGHRMGLINPMLYRLARTRDSGIVDITAGNNGFGGVPGFDARPGYDLASGLGTVDGTHLARSLAAMSANGPSL